MRKKKCVICHFEFQPTRPFEKWCSIDHAIEYANQLKQKTLRKQYKEAKEHAKTRQEWLKEAQAAFNAYIRERDKGKPCICCGLPTKVGDHAGHWKPTSSSPELRFNEDNVHLQRVQCNVFFHGNVANYRNGLIQRIGLDRVQLLERKQPPCHYSIEDLKNIKAEYKRKLKEIT